MASPPTGYVELEGSERLQADGAKLLGPADPNEVLRVLMRVRRKPGAPPLPDLAYWTATPPGRRKFLSTQEFDEIYGALPAELDQVAAHAKSHGLIITETNTARRTVIASGPVEQMNRAFGVELGRYKLGDTEYRGQEGLVYLPADIAPLVECVSGLDGRRIGHDNTAPNADPPGSGLLDAWTVAKLYNFPTNDATGQVIGIITVHPGGFTQSDLTQYFNNLNALNGTNLKPPVVKIAHGGNNNPGNPQNDFEFTQDICVAATVAQGATILVFFETADAAGWIDFVTRASVPHAGDPQPTILSISNFISPADTETKIGQNGFTTMDITTLESAFQEAAAKGVTIFAACGDSGSQFDGSKYSVQWPASNPWVTACGGTSVSDNPFAEWVWNDQDNFGNSVATGGGISDKYALPLYQQGIVTQLSLNDNAARRGLPDVAGNASQNTGYQLWVDGSNKNPNSQTPYIANGTSIVAPFYAGLAAVLNAQLPQSIGFLNPTLYAYHDAVCRDINDKLYPGSPPDNGVGASPGYPSGPGWDACTGLGVIDGGALLSVLQTLFKRSLTLILDRSTFSLDEVKEATAGTFPQALFVVVDGLKPSDFPGGGITQLVTTQTPSAAQLMLLAAWAPSIPSPATTNIKFTPTGVSSDDPSLGPEVQQFTFTYEVVFPDTSAFTNNTLPDPLKITASLPIPSNPPAPTSAEIELINAPDPYFSSESNGGLSWLSDDLRVFYAEQGSTRFGVNQPLGNTPASALSFIQNVIQNFTASQGTAGGETFEGLQSNEQASALSLNANTPPPPMGTGNAIYNFAIARVRLTGTTAANAAAKVRVFFRLWQAQSTVVTYTAPGGGAGAGPPTGPYRQYSDGQDNGRKVPLLGISADGSEYVTMPFFATARVDPSADMTTQLEDTPNAQPIAPPAGGGTTYAFFGAWLDTNQNTNADARFPRQPPANPDGGFSGQTLYTVAKLIAMGGHQCLLAEIVDDTAPIPDGATPSTSDKIAQRNLAFTPVSNPGTVDSRLATHTFEIRPSPAGLGPNDRLDELMIDWRLVPKGSVASIYLPAVAAADVVVLATKLYTIHDLSVADAHTLRCPAGGITYIPIPEGSGANFAGLFSVELPLGIREGQRFDIVVRQVTNASAREKTRSVSRNPLAATAASKKLTWRRVLGTFQISIPVSTKDRMLVPEERFLSIMRWVQETIPRANRWYPVFLRYLGQLSGRVADLGKNPDTIPPTGTGTWPGLGETKPGGDQHSPKHHEHRVFTGKIDGIVYDQFGDFDAFILKTQDGQQLRFESREGEVHMLVQHAWSQRILLTVAVRHDRPERPIEITFMGP